MKTRRLPISAKIIIGSAIISAIVCVLMGVLISLNERGNYVAMIGQEASDVAAIGAADIDVSLLKTIEEGMEESDEYANLTEQMRMVLSSDTIQYIYVLRKEEGQFYYWADADEEEPADIGEECDWCDGMDVAWNGQIACDDDVTTDEWGSVLSGYAPVYDDDGSVIAVVGVDISADVLDINMAGLYRMIAIIVAVAIVINGLGTGIIVSTITRNIKKIVTKLDDIVHNDGDLTKRINMRSGDETEQISNLFDEFMEIFRSIVNETRIHAGKVSESSNGVTAQMQTADEDMSNVAADIRKLSDMMDSTENSMGDINQAVFAIEGISGDIQTTAAEGMDFSKEVNERAANLQKNSSDKRANSKEVATRLTAILEEKIEEARAVKQIAELSSQIVGISSQSNLLALNASIEAARAGEAGKGFAVVAGEISNLASNTKSTAEVIGDVSQSSIQSVEELISVSKELIDYINNSVFADYEDFVEAGKQYSEDASHVYKCMAAFDRLSEELRTKTERIKITASNVENSVAGGNDDIANVVGITDALSTSIKAISEVTNSNSLLVGELATKVDHFKTEE